MGCVKETKIRNIFKQDQLIGKNTFIPLMSTLYNTLRKLDKTIILILPNKQKQNESCLIESVNLRLQGMKPFDLKMLFNFKKVVLCGGSLKEWKTQYLQKIDKVTSPSIIYWVKEQQCYTFVRKYPIFQYKQSPIMPQKIPILVFDSTEFKVVRERQLKVFIHSDTVVDMKIYQLLKIKKQGRIDIQDEQNTDNIIRKQVQKILQNKQQVIILIIHSPKLTRNDLLQILSQSLAAKYKQQIVMIKHYLRKFLPNAPFTLLNPQMKSQVKTVADYTKLFQQYNRSQSRQKTDRAYNELVKLLIDIYFNEEDESSRKLNNSDKQIQQLTCCSSGKKLLKVIGFQQKDGFQVNSTEAKCLKVQRMNLDLAYEQFLKNHSSEFDRSRMFQTSKN